MGTRGIVHGHPPTLSRPISRSGSPYALREDQRAAGARAGRRQARPRLTRAGTAVTASPAAPAARAAPAAAAPATATVSGPPSVADVGWMAGITLVKAAIVALAA